MRDNDVMALTEAHAAQAGQNCQHDYPENITAQRQSKHRETE